MRTTGLGLLLLIPLAVQAMEPEKLQKMKVPPGPWPQGDERGMANQIGPATYARCAWHMQQPGAKAYELSHLRSNTMPLSPFAGPYQVKPKPSAGIPGTAHAFNSEQFNENAEPAQQGTQMDALAHFGALKQPWDGKSEFPAGEALYYGGFTQKDVKPTPDSPLLKLGIDKVPPIVTSAVLLDAKAYKKAAMKDGELVTAKDLEGFPASHCAASNERPGARIVAIALDTPFAVHHHMLAQAGIHLIENAKLDEMAADRVWTSCTMILPLRDQGAAGSAVRPVAIGASTKPVKK